MIYNLLIGGTVYALGFLWWFTWAAQQRPVKPNGSTYPLVMHIIASLLFGLLWPVFVMKRLIFALGPDK